MTTLRLPNLRPVVAKGPRLLLATVVIAVTVTFFLAPENNDRKRIERLGVVAHAGGGQATPNYRSALVNSYRNGHRFFEIDLSWTIDGHLVAVHDWHQFSAPDSPPPLRSVFYATPPTSERMDMRDVCLWHSTVDDATIILDIKSQRLKGMQHAAEICGTEGIIPQVHSSDEYIAAERIGFRHIIVTTYRNSWPLETIKAFVDSNSVLAVTVPYRRVEEHLLELSRSHPDLCIMTHTINSEEVYQDLRGAGICAVYSDNLTPAQTGSDPNGGTLARRLRDSFFN